MTNNTQITMVSKNIKPYDLEERTLEYAKGIIRLCKKIPNSTINIKLIGQLVNASGSVGANYREANDAISKKDFLYRMKISRKECKESTYWLELLKEANQNYSGDADEFITESKELRNILSSIIKKSE
ncbi:MAG: four helix bundle protein [Pseudomonadota bacterium]